MLPLSFRLEEAGRVPRPSAYISSWRRFGNTMMAQIHGGDFRIEVDQSGQEPVQFNLSDGMSFLIPPGCRHRVSNPGTETVISHFAHLHCRIYELQGLFYLLRAPIIFSDKTAERIGQSVDQIIHEQHAEQSLRASTRVASCLAKMVELAVSCCPEIEDMWQHPDRERLLPVLQFIQDHIAEPLDRTQIAAVAGLSIPHLHTIFVRAFGAAPMEVLRRERMQHASQLLHWSDYSIAEVANKCGFEDQYYFSRAFKRWEGVPPSVYRRNMRRDVS